MPQTGKRWKVIQKYRGKGEGGDVRSVPLSKSDAESQTSGKEIKVAQRKEDHTVRPN